MLSSNVIIGAFIACSLAAGLFGYTLKRTAYIKGKLEVTLQPPNASPVMPAPQWSPNTIRTVFVGDSRISQWPLPDAPDGYTFVNRGKGGETTLHLSHRIGPLLNTHMPDIVVLEIGINDLVAASIAPSKAPKIMGNLSAHLDQILKVIQAKDARLLLLTITQPAEPAFQRRAFAWSPHIHHLVKQANDMILARANPPLIKVLDTNAVLGAGSGPLDPKWAVDALHHTPHAYSKLSKALLQELLSS